MTLFGIGLIVIKPEYFTLCTKCFTMYLFLVTFIFFFFLRGMVMSLSNCVHFVFIPSSNVLVTSPKLDHAGYHKKHGCDPKKCWLVSLNVTHYLNMDLEILISLVLVLQV